MREEKQEDQKIRRREGGKTPGREEDVREQKDQKIRKRGFSGPDSPFLIF
jgi:hypothetical protein